MHDGELRPALTPQDGRLWVYLETIGGSGARADKDGSKGSMALFWTTKRVGNSDKADMGVLAVEPELVEHPAHGNLSLENGGSEPDDRQFLVGLLSEAPKACSC